MLRSQFAEKHHSIYFPGKAQQKKNKKCIIEQNYAKISCLTQPNASFRKFVRHNIRNAFDPRGLCNPNCKMEQIYLNNKLARLNEHCYKGLALQFANISKTLLGMLFDLLKKSIFHKFMAIQVIAGSENLTHKNYDIVGINLSKNGHSYVGDKVLY